MLKEAKKWIQHLEEVLTELSTKYQKPLEEIDDAWEQFWYDGGDCYDQGAWELEAIDAFKESYGIQAEEEADSEAYDEVYKKMRAFAADRGYDLEDGEIDNIIEEAEEDGDSVLDCADGALRELVEDWVADHQV